MPVRDEVGFILRSLDAVLSQDFPQDRLEIIVVDGLSTDGTYELVKERFRNAAGGPRAALELISNPLRTTPAALNLGIDRSSGDVILRVDGHCEICPRYVRRCVDLLTVTGADCVGGSTVSLGDTPMAQAIALAQSVAFGTGGASFRTRHARSGFVDTVAFGAYRRDVFTRIGAFDAELLRNQDDELNLRLTIAGGRIWFDDSISAMYWSRSSLLSLWRQYFQYGMYKVRVMQKSGVVATRRQLAPPALVLGLLTALLAGVMTRSKRPVLVVTLPYCAGALASSLQATRGQRRLFRLLPLVFLTLHLAYGSGFIWGLWRWRNRWEGTGTARWIRFFPTRPSPH